MKVKVSFQLKLEVIYTCHSQARGEKKQKLKKLQVNVFHIISDQIALEVISSVPAWKHYI